MLLFKKNCIALILILSFLFGEGIQAADTLRIDSDLIRRDLLPYAALFIDERGEMEWEEIRLASPSFIDQPKAFYESQYPEAYWLRIHLIVAEGGANTYIQIEDRDHPEKLNIFLDFMDLYVLDEEEQLLAHERSGFYVPRKEKSIKSHAVISAVPLHLEEQGFYTMYIRLRNSSDPQSISLAMELRNAQLPVSEPNLSDAWAIQAAIGMLLIIACFGWVFYYFVRDSSFLYFGFFCFFYGLDFLNLEPMGGITRLIPNHPYLVPTLFNVHFFCLFFLLRFGRKYAEIDEHFSWEAKAHKFLEIYFLIVPAYYVIRSFFLPKIPIPSAIMLGIAAIFLLSLRYLISKQVPARIFAGGIFLFLFGNIFGIFVVYQGNSWGVLSWVLGQFVLLLFFAIAMGQRLLKSERMKAERDKIKVLDQLKSRFFANISHEFRTPLSLILGPLQKAEEQLPASEMETAHAEISLSARHLGLMKRNARRLEQLIDQILDLSKLEAGKLSLDISKGSIISFTRKLVSEFTDIAQSKDIHLLSSFGEDKEAVFFDPDKLEKILVNLLSNACKFSGEQGEILIEARVQGPYFHFRIKDSGNGMSQEELAQVFNRFYQADQAKAQGSGIGMALVKELIELHKGQIQISSQEGEGTDISFRISVRKEDFPSAINISPKSKEQSLSLDKVEWEHETVPDLISEEGHEKIILLVEDNQDLQLFMGELLRKEYRLLLANHGQEGWELAREQMPDLILSDIMMPQMSGFELAEKLREDEKTCHIPLILLTARSEEVDKRQGLELGAVDYLKKPFDARELLSKISNQLRLREKWREKLQIKNPLLGKKKYASMDEQFLQKVQAHIQEHLANEYYSVESLAEEVGYSRSQLFRKIKALTGMSPLEVIRKQRLKQAKELIQAKAVSISEAAHQVGYSNLSYFSQSFKKEFGLLPSEVGK